MKLDRAKINYLVRLLQDNFLPFIDLFQKDVIKLDVSRNIMNVFRLKVNEEHINDPLVTHALMYICKIMNDAVK